MSCSGTVVSSGQRNKMRTTGKKLISYTRKPSHLRKGIHSKLNSSSQNKNGCKASYSRRCNFKPHSHIKKAGMRKSLHNGKSTEAMRHDSLSAKHQSSSKLVGNEISCLGNKGNRRNVAHDGSIRKIDKRKKRRRKKRNLELDEASRLRRRARYLLIKMKLERNLIDAYSGDGWKGQSREKIKPEKELQRAEKQILKFKIGIRDAIRQLDLLSSEGSIEDAVIYPDGSVFHEHIFCAKCKSNEAFPDNDIILCDGTCNCGFHQKCLEPPLEKIPPGEQGWLCKFCECKMEILETINAHLGTSFTINNSWEDMFKEAANDPDTETKFLLPAEEWPSEDSEDEDYCPERIENSNTRTGIEESVSDDASCASHLLFSSDEARSYSNSSEYHSWNEGPKDYVKHKSMFDCVASVISIDSSEASDREITSYRRQRRDVDYKKLHDEMFGKHPAENEQQSEDEDWGPHRKKRRKIESDGGTTLVDDRDDAGCSIVVSNEKTSRNRKPLFRIPPYAVEKLRQVFAENELPSRVIKEKLSEQLGISSEKISKWFKNARYAALKIRKAQKTENPCITNITKRLRTSAIKNRKRSSEEVALMDDSCLVPLSSIIRVPKKLRRIIRRNASKSITTHLRKKHKSIANVLPTEKIQKLKTLITEDQLPSMSVKRNLLRELGLTYCQVSTRFTNVKHAKSRVNYLKRKIPLGTTSNTLGRTVSQIDDTTDKEQPVLVEIERLCNLEGRIQKLKEALLICEDSDHASRKTHAREQGVIYVPIAEVKEKE